MYIIAGLGNPGSRYEHTRHNCGFEALDIVAERLKTDITEKKFHSLCGSAFVGGSKVLLMKPQTYMNLSGQAVMEAVSFYKIDPENELIVIYDDISLDCGQLRVRAKGSAGGHNGLKDIISRLGTEHFKRVRIGTGKKPSDMDLADYVLSRFPLSERADMVSAYDKAADAAIDLLTEDAELVMSRYNRKVEQGV